MKLRKLVFLCVCTSPFLSCSQEVAKDTIPKKEPQFNWIVLADGVSYCEVDAPIKSAVNDSKITLIKIKPERFEFKLFIATELDKKALTAPEWAAKYDLDLVMNAGMYDLSRKLISRGYLQNNTHINNAAIHPTFNSMIAFNPKDSSQNLFNIYDLECQAWPKIKHSYNAYIQGLRMIDCNGLPIGWNKRKQSCSMLACSMDESGNIYFIYSRSPYTHNEMISFMLGFPLGLKNTMYLEGGPETSLYLKVGETTIEKFGSYVSDTYPNDLNDHFWKLPNVIGLRLKGE